MRSQRVGTLVCSVRALWIVAYISSETECSVASTLSKHPRRIDRSSGEPNPREFSWSAGAGWGARPGAGCPTNSGPGPGVLCHTRAGRKVQLKTSECRSRFHKPESSSTCLIRCELQQLLREFPTREQIEISQVQLHSFDVWVSSHCLGPSVARSIKLQPSHGPALGTVNLRRCHASTVEHRPTLSRYPRTWKLLARTTADSSIVSVRHAQMVYVDLHPAVGSRDCQNECRRSHARLVSLSPGLHRSGRASPVQAI